MTTHDDRKLLELAAKAAGVEKDERFACFYEGRLRPWNPLTDDGDALRLAVKLSITIDMDWTEVCWTDKNGEIRMLVEDNGSDEYAATRRAIVRAAAAIGESM